MLGLTRHLSSLKTRSLLPDAALVNLPLGVKSCEVFRDVVTLDEEERIYEELSRILQRDGYTVAMEGSSTDNKIVKQTYLEIYGLEKEYTEVKNWSRKEIRKLPGFVWSPTLTKVLREVCATLGSALPDSGRVIEHDFPGYEAHVEHPTVGNTFFYLNLLSDTVLTFDDEASGRSGSVLLPSRSFMRVSDEARWGFRWGELSEDTHSFVSSTGRRKSVECELRMSIQTWKLCPNLIDSQMLQERLSRSIATVEKRMADANTAPDRQSQASGGEEEKETLLNEGASVNPFVTGAFSASSGTGVLGGELTKDTKQNLTDIKENYSRYKDQFSNIHGILQDMKTMQDVGQPINDLWLQKKMKASVNADDEQDRRQGFDPNNIEGTWDNVDAKARFYKEKLKKMDYDGTAFENSRMPDISGDAPLDMKTTIKKIAPFVKDGKNILSNLPQSN